MAPRHGSLEITTLFLRISVSCAALCALAFAAGCATESSRAVEPARTQAAQSAYRGPQTPVIVANFDNRSSYLRGLFSDGTDRLGSQARTILIGHLQQSGRFAVMDRDNSEDTAREAELAGRTQVLTGADFAITGDIVEFGRRDVGDTQLFGILGRGKTQMAYSRVTLNIVDVGSSQVVYTVSGAGEYALSTREVVGFGGTAGYDATLNGKVLDLAIREATDRLVEGVQQGNLRAAPR